MQRGGFSRRLSIPYSFFTRWGPFVALIESRHVPRYLIQYICGQSHQFVPKLGGTHVGAGRCSPAPIPPKLEGGGRMTGLEGRAAKRR